MRFWKGFDYASSPAQAPGPLPSRPAQSVAGGAARHKWRSARPLTSRHRASPPGTALSYNSPRARDCHLDVTTLRRFTTAALRGGGEEGGEGGEGGGRRRGRGRKGAAGRGYPPPPPPPPPPPALLPTTPPCLPRFALNRLSSVWSAFLRAPPPPPPDKKCWECARARGEDGCKAQIVGIDTV